MRDDRPRPDSGATRWQQNGAVSWTEIKELPKARQEFVAGRIMALRAFLADEPDAYAMLDASGAQRPYTHYGEHTPCRCPYCEDRPVKWAGNAVTKKTLPGVR